MSAFRIILFFCACPIPSGKVLETPREKIEKRDRFWLSLLLFHEKETLVLFLSENRN